MSTNVFYSEKIYCFKHVAGCSLKRVGTFAHWHLTFEIEQNDGERDAASRTMVKYHWAGRANI